MAKTPRSHLTPIAPKTPDWPGATQAQIIIDAHRHMDGPMLPTLHALQEAFGYVPTQTEALIATTLNLSRAEVYGVISFYHDFRREPAGKHVLKLCRAEACQAMGADTLAKTLLTQLGLEWGGKTADGALTVEPVFCLGLCACAPAALFDGVPIGRVDSAGLRDLVTESRA